LRQIILPRKRGRLIIVTPLKQADVKQAIHALAEAEEKKIPIRLTEK